MLKRTSLLATVGWVSASALLWLAALAVPARATTTLSTTIVSTSASGPTTHETEQFAIPHCTSGGSNEDLAGGGARATSSTTTNFNSLKLNGTAPSTDGSTVSSNGSTNPSYWAGIAGLADKDLANTTTWGYGVCITSGPSHTTVVVNSTNGPIGTDTFATVTASCPTGDRLLGGGARTTPASVGSLKIEGSFPSDSSGNPSADGATNPTSWTAAGENGGDGNSNNTTYAFALCSTEATNPTVTVMKTEATGPTAASTTQAATTLGCSTLSGSPVLLSGGAFINNNGGEPASQGDHLLGDFPSDTSGNPVTSGSADAWTAQGRTGGQASSGTVTDVWALCGPSSY
jgi:hypothetical protein